MKPYTKTFSGLHSTSVQFLIIFIFKYILSKFKLQLIWIWWKFFMIKVLLLYSDLSLQLYKNSERGSITFKFNIFNIPPPDVLSCCWVIISITPSSSNFTSEILNFSFNLYRKFLSLEFIIIFKISVSFMKLKGTILSVFILCNSSGLPYIFEMFFSLYKS